MSGLVIVMHLQVAFIIVPHKTLSLNEIFTRDVPGCDGDYGRHTSSVGQIETKYA